MNLRRLLASLLLASTAHAAQPTFEWISAGGGAKNDKTRGVAVDQAGNVFMACESTDDGTFGDIPRKGLGGMDFCLVKLDSKGKPLWVRSIGGSLVDRGYAVATDAAGNAYTTGHYQSTDATADGEKLPNAGDYDIFVAKYDRDGKLLWIRTAGGKGYDYGHAIAIDRKGDIVVAGGLGADAMFGDTALNAGHALFCAKYDANGKLLWVRGTSGKASGSAHGVAVDATNHIYIGGSISGVGSFGTAPINTKTGAAIVAKLTPSGNVEWATVNAGTPSAGIHEITADGEGRVWVAGMFKGSFEIGTDTFQSASDKDNDGFTAHYNAEGKVQWARQLHGPATDYCLGVATDGKGTCFLTGEFSETATFAGSSMTTMGVTDIFTAALDVSGNLTWLIQTGGAKGDNAYTMAYQPDGHLIFSGACAAPAAFGSVKLEQSGGADAYAVKMKLP